MAQFTRRPRVLAAALATTLAAGALTGWLAAPRPAAAADDAVPAKATEAPAKRDVVDTAVAAGQFNTLAAALKAAGLVDTLKGPGPFTVFAPTDDAFAKLPAGTVENLLKPENKEKLVAVLTYHVVPGKVTAKDAMALDGKAAKTVNGKEAKISVADGKVKIDGATVIKADVDASNGVIHVIDSVILP